MRFDLPTWIRHLRSVAGERPGRSAALSAGSIEAPVLAACGAATADAPVSTGTLVDGEAAEVSLWRARTEPDLDVAAILESVDAAHRAAASRDADAPAGHGGSLLSRDSYRAIEVWTDADLAGCHALWWLARDRVRRDWADRLDRVRAWHLEHTQPDNATNRPWAIHVFLLSGTPEDEHYAQTLLHNALAIEAKPTPLAQLLLHDAADALEQIVSERDADDRADQSMR